MKFSIKTHDAWGTVEVGRFETLQEARMVFASLCQDPWYSNDGTVKGVELVEDGEGESAGWLDWFAFP